MDIMLVPTGARHPVFKDAITIRNVNFPYDTLGCSVFMVYPRNAWRFTHK